MATQPHSDGSVVILDEEEAFAYFDRSARQLLGVGGDEFLRRWDDGEWAADFDDLDDGVQTLIMLMPFAGRDPAHRAR